MYMANLAKHASPLAMISPIYSFKSMKQITISIYLMIRFNNQMHQVFRHCMPVTEATKKRHACALQRVGPDSCSNSFPGAFYSYVTII